MRLIDADALDFAFPIPDDFNGMMKQIGIEMAKSRVMNAPTVETVPLPCKVGDEVWCLRDTRVYSKPVKGTVTEIYFRDNMDMCIVVRRLCRGRWGERVFATEQEAQAAIDRRLNDEQM